MLTDKEYQEAADELGCELAAIKAVASVESSGKGFFRDGSIKIRFEAHHFSRLTHGAYNVTHPRISSVNWNRKLSYGDVREHARLETATRLDRVAGLKSASWGAFQIMGFNYKVCGYKTLQAFINDMYSDEGQLRAFVGFIKADARLVKALKSKVWATFARIYNGPGYATNKYHTKMAAAYLSFLH